MRSNAVADAPSDAPLLLARPKIAVVIPCFGVAKHILDVLASIGPEVSTVIVVDDACPEQSGDLVEEKCNDPRVIVVRHEKNQGVGGATVTGYRAALETNPEVVVRLDGDGQTDPALIPCFVDPILRGDADYTKGNRFFEPATVVSMPPVRLLGNAILSFFSKLSSGYWNVFDPNNGYTAISAPVLRRLHFDRLERRWFFESDMLYRLGTIRAVVLDIPMRAVYGDEESKLRPGAIILEFAFKHLRNAIKRILYNYFLRDFSVASIELCASLPLLGFGIVFGSREWLQSIAQNRPATSGSVMLAALPVILGIQFLLAFLGHDVQSVPREVLHTRLGQRAD